MKAGHGGPVLGVHALHRDREICLNGRFWKEGRWHGVSLFN